MNNYRDRIYKKYASNMQDASSIFDAEEADRAGIVYGDVFKGWLPAKKEAPILDAASGGGRLLYFLKSKGYTNLVGVDISAEQVKLSRQVCDNVIEADIFNYLESQKEQFDLIMGLDIIEHFCKDEALCFLDNCCAALRSGGRLILQTPNAESIWGLKFIYGDLTHELAFDPRGLQKLLELCGFIKIEHRQVEPVIHGLLSFGRFLLWKTIWAVLALWNLAETGNIGSGIYTRIFLVSGIKK